MQISLFFSRISYILIKFSKLRKFLPKHCCCQPPVPLDDTPQQLRTTGFLEDKPGTYLLAKKDFTGYINTILSKMKIKLISLICLPKLFLSVYKLHFPKCELLSIEHFMACNSILLIFFICIYNKTQCMALKDI